MERYDVIVIGAGPGGYVCAIRCAQLGLRTAVIDQWINKQGEHALGGTCLNVGCIPSKALLDSSEQYHKVQHKLASHGICVGEVKVDLATMLSRKDKVVRTLTGGVATLFLKHKITWLKGTAQFIDVHQIKVMPVTSNSDTGEMVIRGDHIVIATGSTPTAITAAPGDGKYIVDSTGALDFPEIPQRLVVIGGGVIGLELGSVWQRLGSEVIVLNRSEQFLPRVDQQIAKQAYRALTAQGLDIRLQAKLISANTNETGVTVTYEDIQGRHELHADKALVAVGRQPNTLGLNAQAAGVDIDERGFIKVDDRCRTQISHIFAIGDVVRGPMLAHKASEEGIAVAETIAGQQGHVNYQTIPWVIYTWPEIAWVGKTSEELSNENQEFKTGVFPFIGNGRAQAMNETTGMVKVLSDAKTDRLLGVHIVGPNASEIIAEAVVAMEFHGSAEDLARTVHAHPTLAESLHEAALAADGRVIHL